MRNGTNATPSQKNGVVVCQVVGHGRLTGEHAFRQLTKVYRALRLYVNCFQGKEQERSQLLLKPDLTVRRSTRLYRKR